MSRRAVYRVTPEDMISARTCREARDKILLMAPRIGRWIWTTRFTPVWRSKMHEGDVVGSVALALCHAIEYYAPMGDCTPATYLISCCVRWVYRDYAVHWSRPYRVADRRHLADAPRCYSDTELVLRIGNEHWSRVEDTLDAERMLGGLSNRDRMAILAWACERPGVGRMVAYEKYDVTYTDAARAGGCCRENIRQLVGGKRNTKAWQRIANLTSSAMKEAA